MKSSPYAPTNEAVCQAIRELRILEVAEETVGLGLCCHFAMT